MPTMPTNAPATVARGDRVDVEFDSANIDVVVIGSGSAALSAALTAAEGGLRVTVLEKTALLGGTSAMSGAGTWIPANHHASNAGIEDSLVEAITYIRAATPAGWQESEGALWIAFANHAPRMLQFLERHTPLRFALTEEPDVMAERPGGKGHGRMVSPRPLSRRIIGRLGYKIRPSTLPHLFTYQEVYDGDLYHRPVGATLRIAHRLLWRLLTYRRAQGSALIVGLLRGCLDHGCRIETNTRVVELLDDAGNTRIAGVIAETNGTRRAFRSNRGVIIATGGFEWNAEMLARHFPGPIDWLGSPRANEGDGQRLAASAGAALTHMDQANIYPSLPTRYEGKSQGVPIIYQAEPHAILVDRHGRRFVSEYDFNVGEAIDRRDAKTGLPAHLPAWLVADRRFLKQALPFLWYARKSPHWLVSAASLFELAGKIGIPAQRLQATVNRYNDFCAQGRDLDFGRGESVWERFKVGKSGAALAPLEKAPFFATPFNRSILGTKGGARTNANGQVLRPDGSVISGLYAAGLAMANPIGTRAIGPGTTLGPNLTWGFICGTSLLKNDLEVEC